MTTESKGPHVCQGHRQGCIYSSLLCDVLGAALVDAILHRFAADPGIPFLESEPESENVISDETPLERA